MWAVLAGVAAWLKSLFTRKGATQIGQGNVSASASIIGDNSPVLTAGRDINFHAGGGAAGPITKANPTAAAPRPANRGGGREVFAGLPLAPLGRTVKEPRLRIVGTSGEWVV
jgi:hypothetical protein